MSYRMRPINMTGTAPVIQLTNVTELMRYSLGSVDLPNRENTVLVDEANLKTVRIDKAGLRAESRAGYPGTAPAQAARLAAE